MSDNINPAHYRDGGIETIDFIEAKGLDYHLGNVVKYVARAGKKSADAIEDLRKAQWYLAKALHVRGAGPDPRTPRLRIASTPRRPPMRRQTMDASFFAGLIVGAFVFTPLGMVLIDAFTSGAIEDAAREAAKDVENRLLRAYMDGFRNARLQAAAESHGFAELAEARDRRHTERGRAS